MAAGGFREFIPGEVLDEDKINDFLMQGILVFADAAARDAAITTPVEGQFVFLKDTDVTQFYDGTNFVDLATDPVVGEVLIIAGGAGGGAQATNNGASGVDSRFDILRAYGGGAGSLGGSTTVRNGIAGASGGGGGGSQGVGGAGIVAQGNQGRNANSGSGDGGGGGGAGAAGNTVTMVGGAGLSSSITGSSVERSGGGGGGKYTGSPGGTATGGGGAGGNGNTAGSNGTVNTGGGGGGAGGSAGGANNAGGGGGAGGHLTTNFIFAKAAYTVTVGAGGAGGAAGTFAGGNGGSGVVILKTPDNLSAAFSGGVTQTNSTAGGFITYIITATSTTSETVTFS